MMYNYSVALAHRVQHKVIKNIVSMKLIRFKNLYLNIIVLGKYINVLVLYSPILLLILMDMNCTNTLPWSNFLKTLLKRKAL